MTLRTVLLSLQALLSAAEPDDPQDAVVARQYKEHPEMFRQTAKHWTFVYAGGGYIYFTITIMYTYFRLFSMVISAHFKRATNQLQDQQRCLT